MFHQSVLLLDTFLRGSLGPFWKILVEMFLFFFPKSWIMIKVPAVKKGQKMLTNRMSPPNYTDGRRIFSSPPPGDIDDDIM